MEHELAKAPARQQDALPGAMQDETAFDEAIDLGARHAAIVIAVAAVVALVSLFALGTHFSSPDAYAGTIASLDAKKEQVTSLVAGSTASSAAITLLPGDVATPIATKLVDISSDFLIVLTAIYLEKYLLTVLGLVAFRILIPVGCVCVIVAVLLRRPGLQRALLRLAGKLVLLGLAFVLVVPTSVFLSDMIDATYQASIDQTLAEAEQTSEAIAGSAQDADAQAGSGAQDEADEGLLDWIAQLPSTVTSTATSLTDDAQHALNNFIEALAVMIVTSCVIPILVLVFFLWLVKTILGVNVNVPLGMLRPRSFAGRASSAK